MKNLSFRPRGPCANFLGPKNHDFFALFSVFRLYLDNQAFHEKCSMTKL